MAPSHTHPLHAPSTTSKAAAKTIDIPVPDNLDGTTSAVLHAPASAGPSKGGVILISGAGGGISGPGGIYPTIADTLAVLYGLPTVRLDYRMPARDKPCANDVRASMDYLGQEPYRAEKFILVGWSFGGSPCFTVGARDSRVKGIATVASQTASTEGIRRFSPRPVLLMHGDADTVLSPRCAENLSDMYGEKGDKEVVFFPGDNHGLTGHSQEVQGRVVEFVKRVLGVKGDGGVGEAPGDGERVGLMEEGGDLDGERLN